MSKHFLVSQMFVLLQMYILQQSMNPWFIISTTPLKWGKRPIKYHQVMGTTAQKKK